MNEQLRMAIPVLWPAMAVTAAMMLVAWWPRTRGSRLNGQSSAKGWASALALGLAFAAAFIRIINGLPTLPPPEKWQWLLPIAGAGAACGLLAGWLERLGAARWIMAGCSAALTGWAFHPIGSIEQPALWRVGVAAASLITWVCFEGSARRHRGFGTPFLLSLLFAGVSIVILQGRNANISLLAASVSAALGAVAVIALLLPPLSLAAGATYVLSSLFAGLLGVAWMYGIGAPASLAILAATPLLLRACELMPGRTSGWRSFALRAVATVVPVATAVAIAVVEASRQASDDMGY